MKSVCLVLSGGGARGFSHVGAIRALEELRIPISKIIASSMGAVIGARYALSNDVEELTEWCKDFCDKLDEYVETKRAIRLKTDNLRSFFNEVYEGSRVEETRIPLEIIASNFQTGVPSKITSGKLTDAAIAAISMPFVNEPVEVEGILYVDAGLVTNFPLEYYDPEDGVLMGVNAGSVKFDPGDKGLNYFRKLLKLHHVFHLLYSNNVLHKYHESMKVQYATENGIILDIRKELEGFSNKDFHKLNNFIDAGYRSVIQRKEEILKRLK